MRISKVTTKVGDNGTTTLGDGSTVSKSNLRICCIGDIDELNSFVGFAKIVANNVDIEHELSTIQNNLLNLGGELSVPNKKIDLLKNESINQVENSINKMNSLLPPLKEFLIPGDDEFSARLHLARAVCRRSERSIVKLIETEGGSNRWIVYLNRLSDYFFVLARQQVIEAKISEKQWKKN